MKDIPSNYYRQLHETEQRHWWYRGMLEIEAALLGERLERAGQSVLDGGCGAGAFLAWARSLGVFERLAGIDVSPEAIELAREELPEADLRVASLHDLPFDDASFDLAVLNDVIQHVHEDEVDRSLLQLRRVLRPEGALLIRTNGGRRGFRTRDDWRKYDRRLLGETLRRAGLQVERLTAANTAFSLLAAARGRTPRAPTEERHGIPVDHGGPRERVGETLLRLEARYLRRPGRALPYGHTLLAVATPA